MLDAEGRMIGRKNDWKEEVEVKKDEKDLMALVGYIMNEQ